ncbi:hypothetical protein EZV73_15780 [Acidaminobacter sp. JC074]|uniref:hypothetical protein n=1 Tax=Acidaminobacter sp. JC074 TaxID=2530199 RepID=UPI001F113532|nr:hypothetical protein [Acidaminobacter sp. JC074]MCH4889055.1 hypothetical protein [Acidaminobacter sp. JC074]
MRVLKFKINSRDYKAFQDICKEEDIPIKRKLNVLVAKYSAIDTDLDEYFPEDFDQDLRSITLKVNEELYKGCIKSADRFEVSLRKFVPYLIHRLIKESNDPI